MNRTGLYLAACVVLVSVSSSRGEPIAELLAAHKASVDALHCLTVTTRIKAISHDEKREDIYTAEYFRFGDRIKCVGKTPDETEVCVSSGGVVHVYRVRNLKDGARAYTGAVVTANRGIRTKRDPWEIGLLEVSLPNTIDSIPLADLVTKARSAVVAPDEEIGGVPCARFDLTFNCDPKFCRDCWNITIWLSRRHGLLVKKCLYETIMINGKSLRREEEVTEFMRGPSGAWFPKTRRFAASVDNKLSFSLAADYDRLKTPASLPDEAFTITYHNPTPITDFISDTTYDVNEAGVRITPEKVKKPIPRSRTDTPAATPEPKTDTEEEPRSRSHWYVLGPSLAVLVGVAVARWRKRSGRPGSVELVTP